MRCATGTRSPIRRVEHKKIDMHSTYPLVNTRKALLTLSLTSAFSLVRRFSPKLGFYQVFFISLFSPGGTFIENENIS
jgi:hypothetical protein